MFYKLTLFVFFKIKCTGLEGLLTTITGVNMLEMLLGVRPRD